MLTKLFSKLQDIFERLTEPKLVTDTKSIEWLRSKVLNKIFGICISLGLFVLLFSLIAEYKLDKMPIIINALFAYSIVAVTIILKKSLNTKVYALVYVNYSIGITHFIYSTPELGYIWMTLTPIVSALFFSKKRAFFFVFINVLIPLILFLLYDFNLVSYPWLYSGYDSLFNYATLSSVLLVNYVLVILITNIFDALKLSNNEKEKMNEKLSDTNLELEHELYLKNRRLKATLESLRITNSELKDALDKSEENAMRQKQFISMISHEYRTPLTVIQNNVEILKMIPSQEHKAIQDKSLSSIESAIQRKVNLIDKILTLQKTNNADQNNAKVNFNFNKDLREIIDDFGYSKKHNINFELEDVVSKIDLLSFKQVIKNILDNSIKFSNKDLLIIVKTKVTEEGLMLVIEDNGMGMNENEVKNAFNAFFKGKKAETIPGSGVGLSIVNNNIKNMGGSVNILSKEGIGTKVIIKLPLSANLESEQVEVSELKNS